MKRKNQNGFTLVEMAIIMLVAGLLLSAVARLYSVYLSNKDYRQTINNMQISMSALREFYGLKGRYPCPADPTLPPGDPNYGVEQCRADTSDPCPANQTCLPNPTFPVISGRDIDGDGVDDPVTIGVLPVQTLIDGIKDTPFVASQGIDGYGMKIGYAVSENMTKQSLSVQSPANPNIGAISVMDKNGNSLVSPEASAHYVLYSLGEDRIGAYTREGDPMGGCIITSITAPIPPGFNPGTTGIETEKENCDDNDVVFVQDIQYKVEGSDDYYDDVVFIGNNNLTSLWRRSLFSPPGDSYLYNTNLGNVGVGYDNPSIALDINGSLKTKSFAESGLGYCDSTGTSCVHPDFLDEVGDECANPGWAAIGIEDNQLKCAPLLSGTVSFDCPGPPLGPQEFVMGFSNLGSVKCGIPGTP